MKQLEMLYEGKAKQVFRTDDPEKIIIHYKDAATAFNNIKKATIENKGVLNNAISTLIFKELQKAGIKTHYIETINDRDQICRKVTIIPLEVIVRNIIAGSMAQRLGIEEGTQPSNTIYDICYKKDELGDPLINDHHAVALGAVTYDELDLIYAMTSRINEVLRNMFAKMNINLVDFKIEFGRTSDGEIVLADEVSPDTCRLWDMSTNEKLDKDRFRCDLGKVREAYEEILARLRQISDRELHEECGVFGVFGVPDAASLSYYGLHALQHRGQEGAGIVAVDEGGIFRRIKGSGLVTEVFDEAKLATLKGNTAIGHVRYTTAGGGGIENVQPFLFRHNTGDFALAHNGNIVNSALLREYLENKGSLFQSTSDSEILAHLIKKETRYHDRPRIFSIIDALNMLEGAFAFLIMTANRIYACRDKYGLRPLAIGRLGDGYVVSSETCAFDVLGAEFVRDVEPGEIVTIDKQGIRSRDYSMYKRHEMCSMEYIYFARPDSDIDGCNVHAYRKESGRLLFKESPADADIVVGVPDSSLSAAMGYAEASGLPYEMGLIKNKYIGRTFIQPSQELREKGVRMKLSAVRSIVKGKRVVLVDDSIVRGTTSRRIVTMLKEAGATEVHVRIASPQMTHPCFYGVDTSTRDELISAHKDLEGVREEICADSLAFLTPGALLKAGNRKELCMACFTGEYPTALYQSVDEANKDVKC